MEKGLDVVETLQLTCQEKPIIPQGIGGGANLRAENRSREIAAFRKVL